MHHSDDLEAVVDFDVRLESECVYEPPGEDIWPVKLIADASEIVALLPGWGREQPCWPLPLLTVWKLLLGRAGVDSVADSVALDDVFVLINDRRESLPSSAPRAVHLLMDVLAVEGLVRCPLSVSLTHFAEQPTFLAMSSADWSGLASNSSLMRWALLRPPSSPLTRLCSLCPQPTQLNRSGFSGSFTSVPTITLSSSYSMVLNRCFNCLMYFWSFLPSMSPSTKTLWANLVMSLLPAISFKVQMPLFLSLLLCVARKMTQLCCCLKLFNERISFHDASRSSDPGGIIHLRLSMRKTFALWSSIFSFMP